VIRLRVGFVALVAALVLSCSFVGAAGAGNGNLPDIGAVGNGYLGFCRSGSPEKEWSCYLHNLMRAVLAYRDPANELPGLDTLAERSGGFLAANCHMMMHVVGRAYAQKHHVTLGTLQRYLPLSNDPGCSAGFGMGLVMGLGKQLMSGGPKEAQRICNAAPTRFRQYTCYHSLGHAYMRFFHGYLSYSLQACRALGAQAPDCAQGAFHDYWLGLSGEDGAKFTHGTPTTARALCRRQSGVYAVACWYRFYLSLPPKQAPTSAPRIEALCRGLGGDQRAGCIASASLVSSADPFVQLRVCSRLRPGDVDSCLRGVNSQDLPAPLSSGAKLLAGCSRLARVAQAGCYSWFGTALNVLTDGQFRKAGCAQVAAPAGRALCVAGASRMAAPLVTFA
jgi:hypothetical protein